MAEGTPGPGPEAAVSSRFDKLKAFVGFKRAKRGFDPNKFEATKSLIATLDSKTEPFKKPTPLKDQQARDLIVKIGKESSNLTAGLENNESVNTTLATLKQLQDTGYHRHVPEERVTEARALANRLVSGSLPAIDRAIVRTGKTADLQLAMDLVEDAVKEGELSPDGREIDFLIRYFEAGLRSDDSATERSPEFTKYAWIAGNMFVKMDAPQRERAMKMLQGIVADPQLRELALKVISHIPGDPRITDEVQGEVRTTLIRPVVNNLGLNYDELVKAWVTGSDEIVGTSMYSEHNLNQIFSLETSHPGICRTLQTEFGITNFTRYPPELLVDLYEQRNNAEIPYGLMLYPKRDHSGAFYEARGVMSKFYKQLKDLGIGLRVHEVGSKMEIGRAFVGSKRRYGSQNKIGFVILAGHGNPKSITFGETDKNAEAGEEINDTNALSIIHQLDFEGKGVQRVGTLLAEDANIIMVSCSTGAAEGIAKTISTTYPGSLVTAPDAPTDLKGLDVTRDDQGKLHFKVGYRSADMAKSFALGKTI